MDNLINKLTTPENKLKLNNFLGVLRDVVQVNGKVTVLETGNRFILSKSNDIVHVTVSSTFLENLGDFELVVDGSTSFTSNVCLNMNTSPQKVQDNREQVEFSKDGELYKSSLGNGFLDCLEDIRMVNLLKRAGLPEQSFQIVRKYLEECGFNVTVKGEVVEEEPGTTVVNVNGSSESVGERIIIKEVPIYIEKIVIREVPVEVQKVVIKEVPVYVDRPVPVEENNTISKESQNRGVVPEHKDDEPEEVVVTTSKGPLQEPSESEEEESDEESAVESSESVVESSEEPEESVHEPRKLKGRWLNPQKTILKSGEYVYRVNKKIDGPTVLFALGRWDKETNKQVPLKKGDKKIIKKLGNKIA